MPQPLGQSKVLELLEFRKQAVQRLTDALRDYLLTEIEINVVAVTANPAIIVGYEGTTRRTPEERLIAAQEKVNLIEQQIEQFTLALEKALPEAAAVMEASARPMIDMALAEAIKARDEAQKDLESSQSQEVV